MPQKKLKVYCETSFWSYLVGSPTTDEKISRWQCLTRKWHQQEMPLCDVFVSDYVIQEARLGNADHVALRMKVLSGIPKLAAVPESVVPIAERLLSVHALPPDEKTDALHIATAAYHKMDVLLTWNCRHLANLFTLPKTMAVIASLGYACPLIITPERYLEDVRHDS